MQSKEHRNSCAWSTRVTRQRLGSVCLASLSRLSWPTILRRPVRRQWQWQSFLQGEFKRGLGGEARLEPKLQELPGIDNLVERCEVMMEYRGVEIKTKTGSMIEGAALRIGSTMRSRAVQLNVLCKLSSEDALVRDPTEIGKVEFAPMVLKSSEAARSMFNHVLAILESMDSAGIQVTALIKLARAVGFFCGAKAPPAKHGILEPWHAEIWKILGGT